MLKRSTPILIFIFFLIIYYIFSFTKISFGDCMGFVLVIEKAEYIKTATPLSHFLYLNAAIFMSKTFDIDSILTIKLFSVIPAAATISICYMLAKEFVNKASFALFSSVILGLSFTFWRSASTVEVYTYNAFWVSLFLLFTVKALKNKSSIFIFLSGLILGISLWVHIQNIMLIPAYCYSLYALRTRKTALASSLGIFTLSFCLIFYLNYLNGLELKYAFVSDTGPWIENTFKQSFNDLMFDVIKSILYIIYNFNIFSVLIIIGLISYLKKIRLEDYSFNFLLIVILFTFGFATFYAVTDNYVFFIPSYLIFPVFIALGISGIAKKIPFKWFAFIPLLIPFFYLFCFFIAKNLPQAQEFDSKKEYKGGLKYYMLPWLNNNIGAIEFTLENVQTEDNTEALRECSMEFIELRRKYQSLEKVKEL